MEAGDPNPATGSQPVARPETVEEQIDGLRAWIAQVDRRLGIRTLALGLAVVLALAAGIVGVVLAKDAKDNGATKNEVASLRDRVSASTKEASQSTQDTIDEINGRIEALEGRVATIASTQRTSNSELDVAKDDIEELRGDITDLQNQVNSLESSSSSGGSNN
jgi:TolA-binding protein